MCGDKHLQYEQPRPSNIQKPKVAVKPEGKRTEKDLASQIVGDKPVLDAMQKDFEKRSK